jgi:IS5 family transposase
VVRDIERKGPDASGRFSGLLALAHRLLEQERDSKNKLYSVHEPQVECIAKGKVHRRYEFGNKVGFVLSTRKNWIVGIKSFSGNPYDGHTLKDNLQQAERMTDVKIAKAVCDLGYRGHDVDGIEVSIVPRKKKGAPEAIRRLWRRRNAIEPIIGHEKAEHRLERNRLAGELGDQLNAVMAACGFNIKKLLRAFCALIWEWLFNTAVKSVLPDLPSPIIYTIKLV